MATTITATLNDYIISTSSSSYAAMHAGAGLIVGGSTNVNVGQRHFATPAWVGFQGFLSFDTSSIPSGATITAVALKVFPTGAVQDGQMSSGTYNVYAYNFGGTVDSTDWRTAAPGTLLASLSGSAVTTDAYNSFTENGTNFQSAIVKAGTTELMLMSAHFASSTDETSGNSVDILFNSTRHATTINPPQLVVTFSSTVTSDVTSSAAISAAATRDVTSAAALSQVATRDVTSTAALAAPTKSDIGTAAATNAHETTDVTSAASLLIPIKVAHMRGGVVAASSRMGGGIVRGGS
jgi:hypothetical protein